MSVILAFCLVVLMAAVPVEGKRHHHNNNRLMELLTAGIVAKVLQKQEGDDGGGHEYYPVPIHVPIHSSGGHHGHHDHHHSGSHKHHHHITEKIIPIPVPHHTTRIIHINAGEHPHNGSPHQGPSDEGGYDHNGYSNSHTQSQSYTGDGPSPNDDHSYPQSSSPSIQQIFFHDSGLYTPPMQPHPAYMAYRKPAMGMIPAAAAHPAYLVRARYPYIAVRPRSPAVPIAYGSAPVPSPYGVPRTPYASPPMYAVPYRRVPAAATYMNPMVVRRPYMPPPMPPMW